MSKRFAAAILLVLVMCAFAGPAFAFSGENCSFTPKPNWPPKTIILQLRQWASSGGTSWESKACIYYGMGLLGAFMGQNQAAVGAYTHALNIMENFRDAYEARADALMYVGKFDEAEADYAKAEQFPLGQPEAVHSRCWQRAIRGYPLERALADCNAAISAKPREWYFLDSRCLVYFRLDKYAAAIADCAAALKSMPTIAGTLYVRGLAKLRSGDTEGGKTDVAAAKSINGHIDEDYAVFGVVP